MAIKIGITGGIGSGKSVVSRLLRLAGVPVYDTDTECKALMQTDAVIRRQLTALVGEEVYQCGTLNKPLLAAYLFGNTIHAGQVNSIVHPRVRDDFRRWAEARAGRSVVGMESAILLEAGFRCGVDVVVMVYAPEELRIRRAMSRDNSSRELVEKRVRSQMGDELKRKQADFIILNDGETPLIPQVVDLLDRLVR